jgi:hypothetical protein
MLNLMYVLVHSHHYWETSEEENTYPQKYETPKWNNTVVGECIPRADSAEPDEYAYVQEHVYGWLEGVVESLLSKPVAVDHVSLYPYL